MKDVADEDFHSVVGEALLVLIGGVAPFVERVSKAALRDGVEWTDLLRKQDLQHGRATGVYESRDLSLMLRAMTERLGPSGDLFGRHMSRQAQTYATELRDVRDRWARNGRFNAHEAQRAIDTMELLLLAIGAEKEASGVALIKSGVSSIPKAGPAGSGTPAGSRSASNPPGAEMARIEIHAVSDLSYAMAHCRIPLIDHITVESKRGDMPGCVARIDVVSADGTYALPQEIHLDLAADRPTTLRTVDVKLDPASMLTAEEQRPGELRVVITSQAGDVIGEASKHVTILAANQWKANPPQLALEMLSAHIQPNSSAISSLMIDVSDRLLSATGNSAIDGYQSDNPMRVDAIAEAVFSAMRARDIRYAEPPASWGADGQKIRTPAEVLEGRLGTCLDTATTMAAVLEQCGVNSTIWILSGHAFIGYWRTDSALETVTSTEVVDAVNQVELGNIALVETTMVTQRASDVTFADARRDPHVKHLGADLSNVVGVTDVRQARYAGIYPLPSRTVAPDGQIVVIPYKPAAAPVIGPYVSEGGEAPTVAVLPPRVSQWKNALLDLSLRNKLINYTDRAGYRIEVPGPTLGRFEDAISAGDRITLVASDVVQSVDGARGIRFGRDLPEQARELLLADKRSAYIDITEASYKTKLRYLASKARTIVEETGANNLYLAFGMLNWRFNDRDLRSPLVLVPVSLSTANRGEHYGISIDEAGASTPNYCLIEKLRTEFGLEIPGLANPSEDASGIDLGGTFNAVRRAITDAKLHFRVEESVHLAILQFAKFPLWKDLDESWNELSRNTLVKHLIETPTNPYADQVVEVHGVDLDELGVSVPVPADSSQLVAVADAVHGRTFVLEGPPGTGKSQTITNLLAHAIAEGRRVLFVAEKRAALDVVKKRLEAVGLGELSLDIHDKSARPAAARAQIKEALELRISHDRDLLKTNLQVAESTRRSLARYAYRLHAKNAAGQSLYTARSSALAADQEVTPLEVPSALVANGAPETFEAVGRALRFLPEKVELARPRRIHPWGFLDVSAGGFLDVDRIYSAAVEFDAALEELLLAGLELDEVTRAQNPTNFANWAQLAGEARYPLDSVDFLSSERGRAQLNAVADQLAIISSTSPSWSAIAGPGVIDLDVASIHGAALEADQSGWFGRKKRRSAVLARLADVLTVDPSSIDLKTLSAITAEMAQSHEQAQDLRARVAQLPVALFGRQWNPYVFENQLHLRESIASIKRVGERLSLAVQSAHLVDLRQFYSTTAAGALAAPLARFGRAWTSLCEVTGVSLAQQQLWADHDSFAARWWSTRDLRKLNTQASLDYWVELLNHLEPLKVAGMRATRDAILSGEVDADDAGLAFDRGIAIASIAERLEASELGEFDVAGHNKTIRRYTTSAQTIRGELRRSTPAKLLSNRRFDADSQSGQVGGLRRQLERKRGGMSVRQLMDNYGELITQIMPCTLMSPDSVARFFPARADIFDIVVFDEASQIRVADAIGAMGRAKSVVIVGDSKQMPPTSFADASASFDEIEDHNPDVVADEESILTECVHAQVPQQWLSWHYRSQDEALIAFSNFHYYGGGLASFPAPLPAASGSDRGHGISLVRVNGHFERSGSGKTLRTNRIEAERIVQDIRRRFDELPNGTPSLGVITFNAPQRDLIENLLRDAGDDRLLQALDSPDGLFVKNLENVQGDERDTILFSVAFSAKDNGVVPLNFGPLSRPGGERRLNVAVTRARTEVVLYASFDPAELRAEETAQVGTKHLKAYLEMAAKGVQTITDGGRRQPVIDRHRDDIADALRVQGFAVATDVGLSDFRIDIVIADPENPKQPLVAVLLDGTEWFSRRTVADRDGLPLDVLANLMNWPAVERVWMPEWLSNPDQTVDRLREAVVAARQKLLRGDAESRPVPAAPPAIVGGHGQKKLASLTFESAPPATQPPSRQRRHPMIETYSEWTPRECGDVSVLDALPSPWAATQVRNIAHAIIVKEAPVHRDRLARLVASAFGLSRVNEDRRRAIQRVIPAEFERTGGHGFYWQEGADPQNWRVARRPADGSSRALDEVSLVEISNAMAIVAEDTGGIQPEDMKREALALFGGRRRTQAINARLDDALRDGIARGVLEESQSGNIVVPGR